MKLKEYFAESVKWSKSNDPEYPYSASHKGNEIRIRINDFPAEHLYTLIADGKEMNFDEWPGNWNRTGATKKASAAKITILSHGYPKPASSMMKAVTASALNGKKSAGRTLKKTVRAAPRMKTTGKSRSAR